MIRFVNAKINIGLQIVGKRSDGYHNLQTVFYPVGIYAGLPDNPTPFCDILEITRRGERGIEFGFSGNEVKCSEDKNLVSRAARLYSEVVGIDDGVRIGLNKHLPDGAGMGGGSADASFTLSMLNEMKKEEKRLSDHQLAELALQLGADCPFFIYNRPMYGSGVGEILEPINLDLSGFWLVVIKPKIYISTKEAFAGVKPIPGNIDLRTLNRDNITEWQGLVKNDFEDSVFPLYPLLGEIKSRLIDYGAVYASMSGSGSSIYGIFMEKTAAQEAIGIFKESSTIEGSYLLKL